MALPGTVSLVGNSDVAMLRARVWIIRNCESYTIDTYAELNSNGIEYNELQVREEA